MVGLPPLTGFQEDDLVILAELHEAVDALGELHHVLDGVGDLQRALLPHGLAALWHSRDTQGVLAPWLCDPPQGRDETPVLCHGGWWHWDTWGVNCHPNLPLWAASRALTDPPHLHPHLSTAPGDTGCGWGCDSGTHLVLQGTDLLRGVEAPRQALELLRCVLARLQVRLHHVLGHPVCKVGTVGSETWRPQPCPLLWGC